MPLSPDEADAALIRHLAPGIVRLPSGIIALCHWNAPTEFFTEFPPIPNFQDLILAHQARQAREKPKPLLKTLDLASLIRKSHT